MEHLILQDQNANAAHEQFYFTPAQSTAFLATQLNQAAPEPVSTKAQLLAAERAAAARARMAQATHVRTAQKAYLQKQAQDFAAWLAQTTLTTNHTAQSFTSVKIAAEDTQLQLKDELLSKLSTFPPKAAQITCACKILRSHPITLVPEEQQAQAHQRTEEEQLSCDYLALLLTCLKPTERPAFYNTYLSSITTLTGQNRAQLIEQEQAAAYYAPMILRTWAHHFTGAPEAQLTRAWDSAALSHFECCDYELPQQPKAYDVKRTCLALSERAQCVSLEAQQALNDLSLCLNRLQPRYLGTVLRKINPLLKCDGSAFIQGLVKLGRSMTQHFPLVALMAPGITPPDPTDPTKPQTSLEEQVKAYLKSTELKLKGKLRKQAERNDAQFQAELEQAPKQQNSIWAPAPAHQDPDDQGGSGSNDSGSTPDDWGNISDSSGTGSSDKAAATSSATHAEASSTELREHDWFVPTLPASPFGAAQPDAEASSAELREHDWFVPTLPASPFGAAQPDAEASPSEHRTHDWFVPTLPESPFVARKPDSESTHAEHRTHDWFVPMLPESPFGADQPDAEASPAEHRAHDWFVPTLPESPFGATQPDAEASLAEHRTNDWFVPQLPESPFVARKPDSESTIAERSAHDWFVPTLPESPFGAAQPDAETSPAEISTHDWFVPTLPESPFVAAQPDACKKASFVTEPHAPSQADQPETLKPVVPELCYLRKQPTDQLVEIEQVPAFLTRCAQITRDASFPERWEITLPQLYGKQTEKGYVDLVQPKLVNYLDPECWRGATAGMLEQTFVLPQMISARDAQGVPQAFAFSMTAKELVSPASMLTACSEPEFANLCTMCYLTPTCTAQVLAQFHEDWLNNNGGSGFSVSNNPKEPEYMDGNLCDCLKLGISPDEYSGCCYAPLPYDVLRIEQMAVESTIACTEHPFGPIATTGLAPYCNAWRFLTTQRQVRGIKDYDYDQLISQLEHQLRETAVLLRCYCDRRMNYR